MVKKPVCDGCVPDALVGFVEHVGAGRIRLATRSDGRSAGVLIVPDILYPAWKTRMPKGMAKGIQNRYGYCRRVFFEVSELPSEHPFSIGDEDGLLLFAGCGKSIHEGHWVSVPVGVRKPSTALPVVPYDAVASMLCGTARDEKKRE